MIKGLNTLLRQLDELKRFNEVVAEILEKNLKNIEIETKGLVPVRTGFLRDSIQSLGARISNDFVSGEVLASAEYASFVEDKVGFFSNELEENLETVLRDVRSEFERIFK